jgi:hypothetical protein
MRFLRLVSWVHFVEISRDINAFYYYYYY